MAGEKKASWGSRPTSTPRSRGDSLVALLMQKASRDLMRKRSHLAISVYQRFEYGNDRRTGENGEPNAQDACS